ncbi:phosphotransferase [Tengunoibacter tsumagoiensis]|uniref:Aminoglycoside phosphotransferase domain-containing protein n=1 Tax=Tengunoibacter tsumagoiensis TaxID=2014871 RepID=A0A402A2C6_9CHLR|nr:phosphotransferase [Tengunoibacter tsumagoiensis]GCE13151.1 hypothetical protein KTT_30100 [Tengunoibacter tsumagoiensis]
MHEQKIIQRCRQAGLGHPSGSPESITGGLLHLLWKVRTEQGSFAMKVLNPEIMQRPGVRATYELSEEAASAFAEAGIPAVTALSISGKYVQELAGSSCLIFPWIEGNTHSSQATPPDQAYQIGFLLGQMHKMNIHMPKMQPLQIERLLEQRWASIIDNLETKDTIWAREVQQAYPEILEWIALFNRSVPALTSMQVISHRDLDQKNVLWQDAQTPWLIDWEAAGYINPTFEIVDAALNWSGVTSGVVVEQSFRAVLEGYHVAGGKLVIDAEDALAGSSGNWLRWLYYNLRRASGRLSVSVAEQELGIGEVLKTLATLRLLVAHREDWAQWARE